MQYPEKPIRLGVVLLSTTPAGENTVVIVGREPVLARRPPELEKVGGMTLELAAAWVDNMMKDLDVDADDPLAHLAGRWRWNLYLIEPARVSGAADRPSLQGLLALAKKKYEKFVGQPFVGRVPQLPRRAIGPRYMPPAWMVEAITRQRFGGVSQTY